MDVDTCATKIQAAWRGYTSCRLCVAPHLQGVLGGKRLLRTLFGCLARAGMRRLDTLYFELPDICVDECEIAYSRSLADINDVVAPYCGMLLWSMDSPMIADTYWQARRVVGTFAKFSSQKLCINWVFSVLRTVRSDYTEQCEQLVEYAKMVYNAGDLESANAFCDELHLYLLAAFIMPYRESAAQDIQRIWRGFAVRTVHAK